MPCYISKSSLQRYDTDFYPQTILPDDVVQISKEMLLRITEALNNGSTIHFDDDIPIIVAPPPPTLEELMARLRVKRNLMLAQTDGYMLADTPAKLKEKWAPYRQALRDLPQNYPDPNKVVWPTPPF